MSKKIHVKFIGTYGDQRWLRQFPGNVPVWGGCEFILDPVASEYDWLVVYNDLPSKLGEESLPCPREQTVLVTTEPSSIKAYGNAFTSQFGCVLTSQPAWALPHRSRIYSQPALQWFYGMGRQRLVSYDEMAANPPLAKSRLISTVCSTKQQRHTLHHRRYRFTQELKKRIPGLDIFGHGVRPMDDKAESLDPYKYHVAIDLHKEKGRDLFLELVSKSDVVVENMRAGALERKFGIGYRQLRVHPRVPLSRPVRRRRRDDRGQMGGVEALPFGLLVFVLDFAKGAVPVAIAGLLPTHAHEALGPPNALRVGVALCAFLGHLFPVYLGFRGGKGVATLVGALAGVAPTMLLPVLAISGLCVVVALTEVSDHAQRSLAGAAIVAYLGPELLACRRGAVRFLRGHAALRGWSAVRLARHALAPSSYRGWLRRSADGLGGGADEVRDAVSWEVHPRLTPWASDRAHALVRDALLEQSRTALAEETRALHFTLTRIRVSAHAAGCYRQAMAEFGAHPVFPFFDRQVIEACLSVHPWGRSDPWEFKPLLRTAMNSLLPARLLTRTTKGSYSPDVHRGWARHRADVLSLLAEPQLADLGFVDADRIGHHLAGWGASGLPPAYVTDLVALELWTRTTQENPQ